MTRNLLRLLVVVVTTTVAALVVSAPAQAAYCGITWGSLAKGHTGYDPAYDHLNGVRSGQHACFDRLVIDLGGADGFDAYDVRYASQVTQDGSGHVVALRGAAKLQIVLNSMPYDSAGRITYAPANRAELANVSGYRSFRQVAWAGAYEGKTTLGLGVRARLPFRAFILRGPTGSGVTRLVVDVAHAW